VQQRLNVYIHAMLSLHLQTTTKPTNCGPLKLRARVLQHP